jgi:hypothetical protein
VTSEYTAETELEEIRRALVITQRQLRKHKARNEELTHAAFEGAKSAMLAMGGVPTVPKLVTSKTRKNREVALWHLTDWQGAKKTTSYNTQVMKDRVLQFCRKAAAITEVQRADHPVKDCVIMFGGDMVEGLFNFPSQAFEIDSTLFDQYVNVSRLIVDTVLQALLTYETVTIIAEWGNHGRIGSKRDNVPRSDNVDRMCYHLASELLAHDPRVRFHVSGEDIQRVEVGNYRALLIHGDEIGRNGFASPMTIVNHANRWRSGSYPWAFRDVYVGHYHTHAEWPMANGEGSVYQTGSTESDNRYAGVMLAAASTPSQRLHFIDPDKGRVTASYKVWLD